MHHEMVDGVNGTKFAAQVYGFLVRKVLILQIKHMNSRDTLVKKVPVTR
jgi:hypothetical protein